MHETSRLRFHEAPGARSYVCAEERFGDHGVDLGGAGVRVDLDATLTPSEARLLAAELLRNATIAEGG